MKTIIPCGIILCCIHTCSASSPLEHLKKRCINELAQEEAGIKNELYAMLGITHDDVEKLKDTLRDSYYATWRNHDLQQKKLSQPFSQKIQTIVEDITLLFDCAEKVLFVRDDSCTYGIETHAHTIVISEPYLNKYCSNDLEIEAVLIHEIMHIHNEDTLEREAINTFTELYPAQNTQAWHDTQKKLLHFYEKRADIQTGLYGTRYAVARSENFKRLIQSDIPSGDTHPTHETRALYMKKLAHELQAMHIMDLYAKNKRSL